MEDLERDGVLLILVGPVKKENPVIDDIVTPSRKTVEELLARRRVPATYEQRCQHALDIVDMHLHEENPERIDECMKLYTPDAVWEAPARGGSHPSLSHIGYIKGALPDYPPSALMD